MSGSIRDTESQRLKAVMADGQSGVRWILHGHGADLSGDNIKHNRWGIITNEMLHRHSKMKSPCLEIANAFGAAVPD